ncbi:MAG: Ca-activated chloride channel family protein [Verrucomicrobiales bacterium]
MNIFFFADRPICGKLITALIFRFSVVFLYFVAAANAEFSTMKIRNGPHAGEELELVSLEVEACIFGPAATSELTFTVRNPHGNWVEGEMFVDLPPGDEIAGFELEIEGEFRDSVAAPQSLARSVYQGVVNRRIDPGIVEWIAEGRYRIHVFPIAKARRFKLRIDHRVGLEGERQVFRLPLTIPAESKTETAIKFEVHGATGNVVASVDGIPLEVSETGGVFAAQAKNARQEIVVAYESPAEVRLQTPNERGHYFCVLPRSISAPAPTPEFPDKVTIFWDCSRSSADRDRELELARLEADLADAEVTWVMFDIAERVRGEGLPSLRAAVDSNPPDGATNLSAVDFEAVESEAIILVSDGLATIGNSNIGVPKIPVFPLCAAKNFDALFFQKLARETGGAFFDLAGERIETGSELLEAGFLGTPATTNLPPKLLLDYAHRLWARQQLLELVSPWQSGQPKIDELCKAHKVASRWSSLLVLERFQNYLVAKIRPPEGPLADQFDKQVSRQTRANSSVAAHQETYESWRRTSFPEVDSADYLVWDPVIENQIGLSKSDARQRKWRIETRRSFASALAKNTENPGKQANILLQRQGGRSTQVRWGSSEPPTGFLLNRKVIGNLFNRHAPDPFAENSGYANPNQVVVQIPASPEAPKAGESSPDKAAKRASGALSSWDGNPGVAAAFETSGVPRWPDVYEQLLADHGDDFAFFLDAGELLWRAGHHELAVRAVSNLAESGFGNALELRRAALRLASWDERDFAADLFGRIREIQPTLAAEREFALQLLPNLAATLLSEASASESLGGPSIRLLMLREANALSKTQATPRIASDVDLRIVLTWDDPDADFDLRVIDPEGETCYFNQPQTRLGGLLKGDGVFWLTPCIEEFQIREAPPGDYRIQVNLDRWRVRRAQTAPVTVYVEVIRNFGRENESRKRYRAAHRGEAILEFPEASISTN